MEQKGLEPGDRRVAAAGCGTAAVFRGDERPPALRWADGSDRPTPRMSSSRRWRWRSECPPGSPPLRLDATGPGAWDLLSSLRPEPEYLALFCAIVLGLWTRSAVCGSSWERSRPHGVMQQLDRPGFFPVPPHQVFGAEIPTVAHHRQVLRRVGKQRDLRGTDPQSYVG